MARAALYRQLADRLIHDIASGVIAKGTVLPSEPELAKIEGVSRYTVRAALGVLESLGCIERKKHVGTIVIGARRQKSMGRYLSSFSDLDTQANNNPRRVVDVREIVVGNDLAEKISCAPGERLIRFTLVRCGKNPGDIPFVWSSAYVTMDKHETVLLVNKNPERLMADLICERYGLVCARVQQTIEADLLKEEAAKALHSKVGFPCLRITRRYIDSAGKPIVTSVSLYPADRYAFNLDVDMLRP